MNPFDTIVLGYGRDWYFQPAGNYSPVVVFPISISDTGTPIVLTTNGNHTIQTDDKVVVYLHSGNNGIFGANRGNFSATRLTATTLSLQGSAGVNAGTGGFIAKCNDGAGVTGLTCLIKDSHTEGSAVQITKTGNWVASSQGIFLFYFSFSKTDFSVLAQGQEYARSVYYTDASNNPQLLISDTVKVYSK
jgi:hypothetical protein